MILKVIFANSVDPDQTAPLGASLIWVHTVCLYAKIDLKSLQEYSADHINRQHFQMQVSSCRQWRFWSDHMDMQADFSLFWPHTSEGTVSYIVSCYAHRYYHYENTPSQIYENFTTKNWKFSDKNSDIFHITAQNVDCGYSLELPHWGSSKEYPQSMFLSRNKKHNVYPCKPQFYCIKVGFNGVKII